MTRPLDRSQMLVCSREFDSSTTVSTAAVRSFPRRWPQVEAGHDVIMSDSDALWLADPMKDFSLPVVIDSNIVASRGNFPSQIANQWGATMCMGFIFFRATASRAAMGEFVTVMNALVLKRRDDQLAVCMEMFLAHPVS